MRATALFASLFLGLAGLAVAGPARAAASEWVGDAHAAARLVTAVEATGSTSRLDAGLQIRLAPGWHTYWRSPGDAGIPATFDWQGSGNATGFDVAWPAPARFTVSHLETLGYEGAVLLPIAVALARPGAPVRLEVQVEYAACSNICVPYHASLRVDLPAGPAVPGAEAGPIADARDRVPGDVEAIGLRVRGVGVADRGEHAELVVRLEGVPAASLVDIFVEGLGVGSAGQAVADASGLGARIPVLGATASAVSGKPLVFTLVSGTRSAEFRATPETEPPDRAAIPPVETTHLEEHPP